MLVPEEVINELKNRWHLNNLIERGLLVISDSEENRKIYTDEETNISYVDDGGEKVPVYVGDSPVVGIKFTVKELKDKKIPTTLIAKILENQPSEGWLNLNQICENLGLNSKQIEIVKSTLGEKDTVPSEPVE